MQLLVLINLLVRRKNHTVSSAMQDVLMVYKWNFIIYRINLAVQYWVTAAQQWRIQVKENHSGTANLPVWFLHESIWQHRLNDHIDTEWICYCPLELWEILCNELLRRKPVSWLQEIKGVHSSKRYYPLGFFWMYKEQSKRLLFDCHLCRLWQDWVQQKLRKGIT